MAFTARRKSYRQANKIRDAVSGGAKILGRTRSGGVIRTRTNAERAAANRIQTIDIRNTGGNRGSRENGGRTSDVIMTAVTRAKDPRNDDDQRTSAENHLRRNNARSDNRATKLDSPVTFSQDRSTNRSRGAIASLGGGFGSGGRGTSSGTRSFTNVAGTLGLPKPDNLAEAFRIAYESKNMGNSNRFASMLTSGISEGLKALGQKEATAEKTFQAIGARIGNEFEDIYKFYQNPENLSNVVGAFLNSVGVASDQSQFNVAFNNSMVQQFSGVVPRSFTFQWKLYPANAAESAMIFKAIDFLKMYMHPELVDEYLNIIEYPGTFQRIDVRAPNGMILFPIFECVIQDVSVNYTGSGNPYFFNSGAPVSIGLSVTLQEIKSLTREDFRGGSDASGGDDNAAPVQTPAYTEAAVTAQVMGPPGSTSRN